MQLPAIRIAKREGWRVIVADINSQVPGAALADFFANVDLKDKEAMLETARSFDRQYHLDGVFTAGTDFSATVAFVAEKMGLPGIPYQAALKATDKSLMRAAFQEKGVPIPGFIKLEAHDDPFTALQTLAFPLVIKPVDNMGARGVRRIDCREELAPAFAAAIKASRTGRAILEEFMDGPEFSIDAVVYHGDITICGVADRHIFFPPYFVEMGHTMPTACNSTQVQALVDTFKQGVAALGIENGAAKGDVFLTPSGAKIGEIAARLSGGYMSGWTYPYASGIEPTLGALRVAVGLPPGNLIPLYNGFSAERAFISVPGIVQEVKEAAAITQINGVMDFFSRINPGDTVVFPTNNVEKCGNIISKASTRAAAVTSAQQAIKQLKVILREDNAATEDFLFKPLALESIQPFKLTQPANLNAYAQMPLYSGNPETATGISFLPLPALTQESGQDWHGNTLPETLRCIEALAFPIIQKPEATGSLVLGKIFWHTILRGTYQGGLYCLQTLADLLKDKKKFTNRLETWSAYL